MELIKQIDENFNFNNNIIRIVGTYDEPWFVAKDICKILELSNTTEALKFINEKWKRSEIISSASGNQHTNIINEAGLYKLIMRSNKSVAHNFQEVVCEDILPTLRRKGEYKIQSIIDRNKELEEEKLKIEEENKELEEEKLRIEEENKRLEEEKNKKEEELTKLTKKYVKPPKEIIEDKNVVYLMTTEESEKIGEYVIGKATDLNNRKEDYNHNKLHDFKVVYHISLENSKLMDIVEASVLMKLGKYRCKAGRDVFLLPEPDISIFTMVIDECAKFYENVQEDYIVYAKRTYTNEDTQKWKTNRKEVIDGYSEEKKEELKEKEREYKIKNEEAFSELRKIEHEENREEHNKMCREYYEKNKEDVKKQANDYYSNNKSFILDESKKRYEENKDEIKEVRKEYYDKNYKDKIAAQRQKKEKCECGLIVSHYQMNKHRKTEKHIILMEIKNNNQSEVLDADKKRCDCGMVISLPCLQKHVKSKRHKMFIDLIDEMKNGKSDEEEDEEDDECSGCDDDEMCECGFILSKRCMRRHKKSKRHKLLMEKKLKESGKLEENQTFAKIVIVEDEDEESVVTAVLA
jgi:prophage antirepressor-like protein